MRNKISLILCTAGILSFSVARAQQVAAPSASPVPAVVPTTVPNPPEPGSVMPAAPNVAGPAASPATAAPEPPAPIEPPVGTAAGGPGAITPSPAAAGVPVPDQTGQTAQTGTDATLSGTGATTLGAETGAGGRALNEFQGDDVAQVLRLLARQCKMSLVVSDRISDAQPPMKVTMRLENKTPMEAINIIVFDKGLNMIEKDGVYYVRTKEEKEAEPSIPGFYTFSYAQAEKILPLLNAELESKVPAQFDPRTNTVFFREVGSNMDAIKQFLATVDQPTKQVMIEARLLEVTANPSQAYGFNWGGIFGDATTPQTFAYGGSNNTGYAATSTSVNGVTGPTTGANNNTFSQGSNIFGNVGNFLLGGAGKNLGKALGGQFAILSVPEMQITMQFLNNDADAELLANPRIVTSDNQQATIKITRNQPVPQLNFNEQTAQAVFGGFQDKNYGNTLTVTPSINKDDFVTLNVKPEISNKVADSVFTFSGATVSSPIIDTRDIESTVLIKSGDTLAIGGLLQDEVDKTHNKVPVLGDIPGIGYAFQEHVNVRTKRNLLIFVTPTIIRQGYGTGLEDQVTGLHHSGEEYADPNGWRNNASGAYRLVPTSRRQIAADYPRPGVPQQPQHDPNAAAVELNTSPAGN
jgi:type IV pilus secretin PilQ/predicted competence protein